MTSCEQGIEHIFDSRSTHFAEEILAATNGEGVDVAETLNGDMIDASVSFRDGGRFIEIGKIDIWSPEQMAAAAHVRDAAFDLGEEDGRSGSIQTLLATLTARFAGSECLLPLKLYAVGDAVAVFREMAQGKHRGKAGLEPGAGPVSR